MAACEVLPLNIACWGCGAGKKGSYNYPPTAYIQIEFCESDMTDAQYFHTGYAYLVELVADLCRKYGFSVDKITSHKEAAAAGYASNHGDPESYFFGFGENMDKFRSRVAAKLAEKTDIIYRVQVGAFRSKENAQKMFEALKEKFGFEYIGSTLRESRSASDNGWSALLYDGKEFYHTTSYDIHLVDRGGGGASFAAGMIYGILSGFDIKKTGEFAAATSALKQTISGDFNLVDLKEVYSLMGGNTSGRVQR